MDDIIEKLENINKFLSLMGDKNQTNFLVNESNIILELEKNIDILYKKIISCNLPEDICEEIETKNKKNKIVAKSLFPCYWALTDYLDKMTNDELNNI